MNSAFGLSRLNAPVPVGAAEPMTIPDEQHEAAAFLHHLAGRPPIETHISAVFIGGDTVWKLKKAVNLGFLDFTTLPRRHAFLQRELALNQKGAPEIYRDIAAIVRLREGGLGLTPAPAADAAVVEWVLRMAPIPAADFLDAIAARGELTPALLDALGDTVARFHAALPPVMGWDSPGALHAVAEGNVRAALAAGLDPAQVRAWGAATEAALAERAGWLKARARAGFVRRAHGDLHLGNLCLWHGVPLPFDALEFDEAMATIDLGYDLAFLLMDLDLRVGRAAANRVLNRYVARTGDAALTHGLPPFLSLRAMVLAHIRASLGRAAEAARYLDAAEAYLRPPSPRLIAMGGLQGTGKSTLARALAPALGAAPGALILRSDEIRKRLHGVSPEQPLPESAYTPEEHKRVAATLADTAAQTAAGGHTVIADATFLSPEGRRSIEDAAARAGVSFTGLWLEAPLPVLEQRVGARNGDASDADVAVLQRAAAYETGPITWRHVNATDREQALAQAQRLLTR
jgi:uncharacterized protein